MNKINKVDEYQVINSPFKWVGGKSRLRNQIVALIPEHTCYVELFAGAAWVLFAKPPSKVEILNDIDTELVNFFRVVKYQPEEFIRSFEWDLVSRDEFERLANIDISTLTEIERAHRFYYIIMAGWGGELHYPRFQTSITDGGHGNRLIGALKYLKERIEPVYERLHKVIIENLDWKACFERYDRSKTVMYIDPPYPNNGCNYLYNMRNWDEHRQLAEYLSNAKCQWILSSYDIPEIHSLYHNFHIIPVQSYSGMRVKKDDTSRILNKEVLVTNFEVQQIHHQEIEVGQMLLLENALAYGDSYSA
ncbi:D12 class N6 adenine-specific DNA methyltransferase [Candidatus Vecturithrix granuli]|uniref:site-specific DNA-methyltransferase (adenine-specific) n=1 Tax=Vecturithrix granuli TaxID=1499967 RepID=A0A081C637_VECG1|nr:D12 class N6 adenine-specific DNA methyltransferase [Candidatus Vecturithrix granuli]